MHRASILSAVLGGLTLLACVAPSGTRSAAAAAAAAGEPARVAFVDLRSGATFALVNESHTDRVELHSRVQSDLSTKVVSDEVMGALLEYLDEDTELSRYAVPGPAPVDSRWTQTAEVETPSRTWHVAVARGTPAGEQQAFGESYRNFLALWNSVYQAQAVTGDKGAALLGAGPSDPKR